MVLKVKVLKRNGKTIVIEVEGGNIRMKRVNSKAATPQLYQSRQPQVIESEIVQERTLPPAGSEGFIKALWNNYRQKKILKSRLNAEREIYKEQAGALKAKLDVMKLKKDILKETLEMEWLRSGKYAEIIEQRYLGKGLSSIKRHCKRRFLSYLRKSIMGRSTKDAMNKTEEILTLIERYRFMSQSQVMRKIWGSDDRQSSKNLNKYFKKSVVEELVKEGRLYVEEIDGQTAYSTHHNQIRKHEILITEQIFRLEYQAKHNGFGFDFSFPRFDEISLRPDGAVKFTDTGRLLLCFIEIHLETESEPVLKEKLGRYMLLAEEHVFQREIDSLIKEGFLPRPKTLGFRVLLYSYKEREFEDRRFISLLLNGELKDGIWN